MPSRSTERLTKLFEQELRDLDARLAETAARRKKPRVSRALDQQINEYASEVRTSGSTPEQMLVELKTMLAGVAPEVPSSERSHLMAELTGRAIDAFFGRPDPATDKR